MSQRITRVGTFVSVFAVLVLASTASYGQISLARIGEFRVSDFNDYAEEIFDEGAAEIVAHDADSQRMFIVNGAQTRIDIVDVSDPTSPSQVGSIDVSLYGDSAQSVAVRKGRGEVAIALANEVETDPGSVAFFSTNGRFLSQVTVGVLPDMITFTPDGSRALTANEGQPDDDYLIDPEGSVSVIHLRGGARRVRQRDVMEIDFRRFNGLEGLLRFHGIRIFGPGATAAQDFEPEYITVDRNSRRAWVVLQENNAIAELDVVAGRVTNIFSLGYKNHLLPRNALDVSNKDDAINIANWPVLGMYQPDSISSYRAFGRSFIVTANEGDSRDYDGFSEEERVGGVTLAPRFFERFGDDLQADERLGRLKITTTLGADDNGVFHRLYAYGARSFSIWTASGRQVYDSGDDFE
ncbi:MAG: choice-of-anchor I family protein, partial [Planctomycetota bacterium]